MNAPIKPTNAAHEALLSTDDALCVDAVAAATGLNKRDAARQLKKLAGLGMIEPEFRAGGVPFYRLIAVQEAGDSEGGEADAPAADADGWIPWVATAGCFSPVPAETEVRVRLKSQEQRDCRADEISWGTLPATMYRVEAYKIIAQAPADFATTPELQYLAPEDYEMPPADPDFLAAANRALGEQLETITSERDDLRARLDAVTQQSIADTDALTAQIEHLRAELETARAEAIALKTLEGAMPGFGAEYDAQRIASLTAELQALRTSNANAINEADRLRAELATERQACEALQEQAGDEAVDVKDAAVGYLVRVPKRAPLLRRKPESARAAALSAVRAGAAHAEVLAVVPVGTARRGAEWRGA